MGWVAQQHVGSSWTRDQIYVLYTGRQILKSLNHQKSPNNQFLPKGVLWKFQTQRNRIICPILHGINTEDFSLQIQVGYGWMAESCNSSKVNQSHLWYVGWNDLKTSTADFNAWVDSVFLGFLTARQPQNSWNFYMTTQDQTSLLAHLLVTRALCFRRPKHRSIVDRMPKRKKK